MDLRGIEPLTSALRTQRSPEQSSYATSTKMVDWLRKTDVFRLL